MPPESLDLINVHDSFKDCLHGDEDVLVDKYVAGYTELIKFLNLIGSVFSFVSSDVVSKIKIMEEHMSGENGNNYESCKKMMHYEKESGLHKKNGFTSGSRTLLRLHRGLDFIRKFLKELGTSDNSINTCNLCRECYSDSLANFHPWYIRQAATLAMIALPHRHNLLVKVFGCDEKMQEALNILPQTLELCDEVYGRVEKLYTDFDFHGLP